MPPAPFGQATMHLWGAETELEFALEALKADLAVPQHLGPAVERALVDVRRALEAVAAARPAGPVTACERCGEALRLVKRLAEAEAWIGVCLKVGCPNARSPVVLAASGAVMQQASDAVGADVVSSSGPMPSGNGTGDR